MQPSDAPPAGLLRRTLVGEYLCLALMLHAALGAAVSVAFAASTPGLLLGVAAACWVICRAAGGFAQRGFSPFVSAALLVAVLAFGAGELSQSSPLGATLLRSAFAAMLATVLAIDSLELVASRRGAGLAERLRSVNWSRIVVWGGLATLAGYLVLIPTVALLIEQWWPTRISGPVPDMSFSEQVRLRTTEAITAFVFFSFGAAVGSFLNVVAYRAPRGESVAFQRSRCPSCGVQIGGRDNVPILGWLLLSGRCRDCQAPISLRYPVVETAAASLFLLLYFIELISGGANIAERRSNLHHGVVWILLYTKWDLVGLYLFHCFALCALLTWALIDIDARRIPGWLRWAVFLVLGGVPAIWPELLPVGWWRLGTTAQAAPGWLLSSSVGTSLLGGLVGALLGWFASAAIGRAGRGENARPASSNDPLGPPGGHAASAGAVVGLSLGWQAAVGVWLLTLGLRPIVAWTARRAKRAEPPITLVLLVACFLQLIGWRLSSVSWWPSAQTTLGAWAAIGLVLVALWVLNRAIPWQVRRLERVARPAEAPVLEIPSLAPGTAAEHDPTD